MYKLVIECLNYCIFFL